MDGGDRLHFDKNLRESLDKATRYVSEGVEQILADKLDQHHGVSLSPGATALASLALLALGREFKGAQQRGIQWLWQNNRGGWGKVPDSQPDEEITKIARLALQGSQGGWMAKLQILSQARQFSQMILTLGQRVVPGLEGPTPEEIVIPNILEEKVLAKLPIYGRPVVVAASLLATESQEGLRVGIQYLLSTQMPDGSWSEDIIGTSLAVLAIMRLKGYSEPCQKAGRWLLRKQYANGGWPAFDQLKNWAMGWAIGITAETAESLEENPWLERGVAWLKKAQNTDGSYGSTPPYTHPDLDDTAVALIGLHQVGVENPSGIQLLKKMQNADGSWSTFPSFQGTPPQITSDFPVYIPSADVTIHALEALWQRARSQEGAIYRGLSWLLSQQDVKGAFPSSWYEGPVYCTAQALELFDKWKFNWQQLYLTRDIWGARQKAINFILQSQGEDGGWGSAAETGLALSGLLRYGRAVPKEVLDKGILNLINSQNLMGSFKPSYKAIYAKGWDYEEPITAVLTAIRALSRYEQLFAKVK
ncbi:squalene cyclase [Desulfitobacterium dichloroeliminans LMG P-21439]|uniref:Squalene cyclase n=1 Tax=Desulfitobacterium dichloroeliminans (strain LMG P-21439 / DCA1) TaxID=871963 RepID=L0FBZ8_DESDL|nr:prenyltransferase/squalene oxidase repeat-containing protein [Desulfitobacterium dichloroeliminans]AGA70747.1 squalene cyclase [Desulfitobacterium dichloroeliminans LMG P-21439]